jgi:hypothetical protein
MIAPRIRQLIIGGFAAVGLLLSIAPSFAQPAPVPALPDTERRTSYSITASQCSCAVNFALFGDSTDFSNWVEVYLNGALVQYNDPTFGWAITSPSGPLSTIARPITDAVLTFNQAQTGTVQIVGARRPRRTSQFQENSGVPTRNFNVVLSDIIAQNRETWDKINDVTGRAVLGIPGETMALLPAKASRQNMGACFDSNGNLTSCVSIPSSAISAGNGITFTGTAPTVIATNPATIAAAVVPAIVGASIAPSKVNNICYVDGATFATLASALSTCSSNSKIIVNSNQTISSNITVTGNSVQIECANGAILSWPTVNITLSMSGSDSGISNCFLQGPGIGVVGGLNAYVKLTGVRNFFIGNTVTGFPSSNAQGIINSTTASDISYFRLLNNNIFGNADIAWEANPTGLAQHIRIQGNYLSNGIHFIPQVGSFPHDFMVSNNQLDVNSSGTLNYACLQIQGGNVQMRNVNLTNNACTNFGGPTVQFGQNAWSLGGYNGFVIGGNVYNPNGFSFTNGGFLMEINGLNNDGAVTGNTIVGNGDDQSLIVCEQCNGVTVAYNYVRAYVVGGTGLAVRNNSSFLPGFSAENTSVIGNTVIQPANATGRGIDYDCENSTGDCSGFMVSNNQVFNTTRAAGSIGISVRTSGTNNMALGVISSNVIHGNATGVVVGGIGNNLFCYQTGFNDGTATTSLSGTSLCN